MNELRLSDEARQALRRILIKEIGQEGVQKLGDEGVNDLGVRLLRLTAIWFRVRKAQGKGRCQYYGPQSG